jgi:glycosyltransferase involved in cell wall biosynthesis|tara:strand:- start:82 stop:969 length:888 start_codon:yes stop_codon:yes gene_type:complete
LEIVIGIPAFNEEKNIASIILKLKKITNTIIVCNDGSSDLTNKIAEQLGAIVINHSKNLGYGAAIRSIFLKAKEMNSDILVTFDADGQHRIEDIQQMIQPIIENKTDIVIGSRFLNKEKDEVPTYRKVGIKIITKVTNVSIDQKITDSQSGFRAYSRQVLEKLSPSDVGMGISTEILIKSSKMGFKILEVPIKILYEGKNTSTHNPISHGTSVLFSTIKYTSIEHPLKFYGIPAVIFVMIGLSFTAWSIQVYAETGKIITNITLIGVGTTIIGVIFIITAILLYSLVSVVRERKN